MEVILIEGKENTGKTTLCKMIEEIFIESGFELLVREARPLCGYEKDFSAIYRNGEYCIIINSESETAGRDRLKRMYNDNKFSGYTLLITAIRPEKDNVTRIELTLNGMIKSIYKDDYKKEHIIKLERIENDYCFYLTEKLKNDFSSILDKINLRLETNT